MNELLQKILYLTDKASFVVRDAIHADEVQNIEYPIHQLDGFYVLWHTSNAAPCPTQTQLDVIDLSALNLKKEADRKESRNKQYAKDLSMKAAYRIERKGNQDLKFSDYLDNLESEEIE